MGETRKTYRTSVGKRLGRWPKIELMKLRCEDVKWMEIMQDHVQLVGFISNVETLRSATQN